jgi:hypothetical protein
VEMVILATKIECRKGIMMHYYQGGKSFYESKVTCNSLSEERDTRQGEGCEL